ncbi:MAG: pyridoxamine 5'-phosphate oxidase [Herpetosiphon sp.]
MSITDLRKEYTRGGLTEQDVDADPVKQFGAWLDQSLSAQLIEPYAMTLATATPDGRPSARIVLLRGYDEQGFVFYTSYDGHKSRELDINPYAALVFYWPELERQVRIEGTVSPVSAAESDAYYAGRPIRSRLGAWASPQSEVIPDRQFLEARLAAIETRFADQPVVPRPPFWGGFRVAPTTFEFWQGRRSRLHDRLLYRRDASGVWFIERLGP